ncbi:hypothetical protein ALT721_660011 [Alteromonas alvinellae]
MSVLLDRNLAFVMLKKLTIKRRSATKLVGTASFLRIVKLSKFSM